MNARRLLTPMAALLLLGGAGCEDVPDHCLGYTYACLNVTVDSGPVEVYRLRVNVVQGIDTSTVLTPKKEATAPLVYPLRFAIRFGVFPDIFDGSISFDTIALDADFDVTGQTTTVVKLMNEEKLDVHVSLDAPIVVPDMSSSTPDLFAPDLANPQSPPDLLTAPDMP